MNASVSPAPAPKVQPDEISLGSIARIILAHRRLIYGLTAFGLVAGLAFGLFSRRMYQASATFIPQASSMGSASGLALAASQLGIQMPLPGGANMWGPSVYVEVLRSRSLLDPILSDTVTIAEEGRVARVSELLGVDTSLPPGRQMDLAVRKLGKVMTVSEDKKISGVDLSIATRWPSVSLALAERFVRSVNDFNVRVLKSQASEEREYAEQQATAAERALRQAEDSLQDFLLRNRVIGPTLQFEQDRLQRVVGLRQSVFTSLAQSREEARVREVRETPVITLIESPQLPATPRSRRTAVKAIGGAAAGFLLAVLIAVATEWMRNARASQEPETRQLMAMLDDAMPFSRRRSS